MIEEKGETAMTIRHLQIFKAVAEAGKMGQAARQLYISQPTVSKAIGDLEKEYGVLLFDRLAQKLYITEAGTRLLRYARQLLALCPAFDCLDEYRARCFVPGHWVTVCTGTETYAAKALAIDEEGRLVVQRENGRPQALRCGEVTTRPARTE